MVVKQQEMQRMMVPAPIELTEPSEPPDPGSVIEANGAATRQPLPSDPPNPPDSEASMAAVGTSVTEGCAGMSAVTVASEVRIETAATTVMAEALDATVTLTTEARAKMANAGRAPSGSNVQEQKNVGGQEQNSTQGAHFLT